DDLDDLDLPVARGRDDDVDGRRLLLGSGAVTGGRGGGGGGGDGGRRYAELLLERLDALAELEHGDALELVDPFLGRGHSVLLRFGVVGLRRSIRLVVVGVGSVCPRLGPGRSLGGVRLRRGLGGRRLRRGLGGARLRRGRGGRRLRRGRGGLRLRRGRRLARRDLARRLLLGDLAELQREALDQRVEAADNA